MAAEEAIVMVRALEKVIDAIWRAHGEQMMESMISGDAPRQHCGQQPLPMRHSSHPTF